MPLAVRPNQPRRSLLRGAVAIPVALIFAARVMQMAGVEPENGGDQEWRKSVAKFDRTRDTLLRNADKQAGTGPFRPNWESLETYRVPDWYRDAKFGIFIHWGVYSVPAFGSEWYARNMYVEGTPEFKHHVATFGPQLSFGYKDFIPRFKAEAFDAQAWAKLFRDAGAKYVIPVAEHHDGFAMYDSDLSDWTAAKMGPHRDVVGELARAVRAAGLHFGASSHRAEHYFFMNGGRAFPSDVQDPRYASFYGPAHPGVTSKNDWAAKPDQAYVNDWLARSTEIVTKYKPEVMWFDWWIETEQFAPSLQRFAAFYYNDAASRGSSAVINYKKKAFPERAAVLDIERGQLDTSRDLFWQTDTSVSVRSWGYIDNDRFRSPESLVHELVDIVSKNGCLLLNIGPKPDGTIPQEEQDVLLAMGRWLARNGEAIYGTRPWKTYGEGPTKVAAGAFHDAATNKFSSEDIRFTSKGNHLYAIALGWPSDGKLAIRSLGKLAPAGNLSIRKVEMLGSDAPIEWTQDNEALRVQTPPARTGEFAYVFRLTLSDRP